MRHESNVITFRDKFSNQPVGVLIGTPLPGSMRACKVERNTEGQENLLIPCELAAAVGNNGSNQLRRELAELRDHGIAGSFRSRVRKFCRQGKAGFSLYQR